VPGHPVSRDNSLPSTDLGASAPPPDTTPDPVPDAVPDTTPDPVLPRGVVVLLGTGGVVITAVGLRAFSGIAAPTFLALVLTIAVSPLRRLLIRRGARKWVAGLVALIVVNAVLLGLAAAMFLAVAQLATLLPKYQANVADLVDDVRGWLGSEQIQAVVQKLDVAQLLDVLQGWLTGLLGVFSNLTFVVVLLFFMGLDATQFTDRLIEAARLRPGVAGALIGFARGTTRYLIVSSIFGLIVAVIDVGVLYLLDIPLPWLWGLLAFITNYIPNVGFFIGVIPPALLGLLEGGWETLLWVIVAYSVINFIIQSIIQPKIVGDAVGMSTTLTFLSLVFWAWILGPLGAVLAIPLSLLVKALLLDADPSTRWMSGLISGAKIQDDIPEPAPKQVQPEEAAAPAS
jgi:AI-2 transport protein TqsA